MNFRVIKYGVVTALLVLLVGCRGDMPVIEPELEYLDEGLDLTAPDAIKGFYLLNQGNMGSNKASIDFYNYCNGTYMRNIFPSRNPTVVKELGDVGNDIGVYGSKMYAVINCSNYIEVARAADTRHLGEIQVANCRYIVFDGPYAYVSSYAGPVEMNPESRPGKVVEIDTLTLTVTREVTVGFQPEQMVVNDHKLYVANSGGYRYPNYDRTVSVIDIATMKVIKTIDVAPNLNRMVIDRRGQIYVVSRGDLKKLGPDVYVIDSNTNQLTGRLNIQADLLAINGDILYMICNADYGKKAQFISYDLVEDKVLSYNFIDYSVSSNITTPYCLCINPQSGDIYIGDAGDYVTPGTLYCFTSSGIFKWKVNTGDIPVALAFTTIRYE